MEDRQCTARGHRSAGRVTAKLLLSWLIACSTLSTTSALWADGWLNGPNQMPLVSPSPLSTYEPEAPLPPSDKEHDFTLRHIFHHGTHQYPKLHVRRDIKPDDDVWVTADDGIENEERKRLGTLHAKSEATTIERLSNRKVATVQAMYHEARMRGSAPKLDRSAWTMDEVSGPNITDKATVLTFAKMTWDAYDQEPRIGDWQDVDRGGFNHSQGFGWEGDGLRGHVFADKTNSTIVLSIKGTSAGMITHSFSFSYHGPDLNFSSL